MIKEVTAHLTGNLNGRHVPCTLGFIILLSYLLLLLLLLFIIFLLLLPVPNKLNNTKQCNV